MSKIINNHVRKGQVEIGQDKAGKDSTEQNRTRLIKMEYKIT